MWGLETRSRLETVSRPVFEVLILVSVLNAEILVLVLVLKTQVLVLVLVSTAKVLILVSVSKVQVLVLSWSCKKRSWIFSRPSESYISYIAYCLDISIFIIVTRLSFEFNVIIYLITAGFVSFTGDSTRASCYKFLARDLFNLIYNNVWNYFK